VHVRGLGFALRRLNLNVHKGDSSLVGLGAGGWSGGGLGCG
jgi:hypothetical protein